jgi:hypothetical protein
LLGEQHLIKSRKLPAELRNKIYGFALADEEVVFISSKTKGYRRVAKRCTSTTCDPQYNSGNRYRYYSHYNNNESQEEEDEHEPTIFSPDLLAVSKTIHAEAASFLYSQRFVVADNYALLTFLNQIGPQHASMLRELTIQSWCSSRSHKSINYPAMCLLSTSTSLESLNIDCSVGYFRDYGWRRNTRKTTECAVRVARKVFRDCHPWLQAVGRAKGNITAGVDMIKIHAKKNFEDINGGPGLDVQMDLFKKELRRLLRA